MEMLLKSYKKPNTFCALGLRSYWQWSYNSQIIGLAVIAILLRRWCWGAWSQFRVIVLLQFCIAFQWWVHATFFIVIVRIHLISKSVSADHGIYCSIRKLRYRHCHYKAFPTLHFINIAMIQLRFNGRL